MNIDKYMKVVLKEIFSYNIEENLSSNSLVNTYVNLTMSLDKFPLFLSIYDKIKNTEYPLKITIIDLELTTSIDNNLIYKTLKLINELDNFILNIDFILSDDKIKSYNNIMNKMGWNYQDYTNIYMYIDRNPLSNKENMSLELAMGNIMFPEEKLIWLNNNILELIKDRIGIDKYLATIKLKEIGYEFYKIMKSSYDIYELNDFDKMYITYQFIKKNIRYAKEFVSISSDGKSHLIKDTPEYISEPYGTFINQSGVCEGQARLMTTLLNNQYMLIDAVTIYGMCDYGYHAWVGMVSDNKLYLCCPTINGPFLKLSDYGYIPDNFNIYPKIYEEDNLSKGQIEKIKHKVRIK